MNRTYCLPAYWASYLINGDDSSLSPGEKEVIDGFLRDEGLQGMSAHCSDVQYFAGYNDATNIGGDCLDYTFV